MQQSTDQCNPWKDSLPDFIRIKAGHLIVLGPTTVGDRWREISGIKHK